MLDTRYDASLKAHVSTDADDKVRHIRYSEEFWPSSENSPRLAANEYLLDLAETLQIPSEQLGGLHKKVQQLAPRDQGVEYQLDAEKRAFDSATVSYAQTYFDVPVWRRGISVKVKEAPNRIVAATDNSETDLEGEMPSEQAIERYRTLIRAARAYRDPLRTRGDEDEPEEATSLLRQILGDSKRRTAKSNGTTLLNGRFVAYKYLPDRRYAGKPEPTGNTQRDASLEEAPPPFIELPAVSEDIRPGRTYLVAELIFRRDLPGYEGMVWLTLVEPETGAVLYIEPMTSGVNGMVFKRDPMVRTGDLNITSDDSNDILDDYDYDEVLHALSPPSGGVQSLSGTFVVIQNEEDPNIAPPTQPAGTDFDFLPRTDGFAAVNAYYHQTELFRTMEDLGFVIADYFDGTKFPIPVDHRSLGTQINAHWAPNGMGGTDHMCYGLCDVTNIAQPLGRAVDPWVHWHEMGGHGTLGDHVGSGNFGFAHSAGDGLAALQMDPDSALRNVPERFRYAPFRPSLDRRFDRPVPAWAWGSANDDTGYGSEEILATCHFRAYRSIGGDHPNLARRRFASRVMTYLILRSIGNLTPATNPSNWDPVSMTNVPGRGAQLWCEELQDTDLENWTSEGLSGGAYNKVIRWAFEKQGSYGGAPPAVDVYIDDGRAGEYQFQAVHWQNQSMWNRNTADGLAGHQNALPGVTNFMYVQVKNRGTSAANNVVVKGYHCLPGAGLTWPVDFTPMSPAAGLAAASIGPNSTDTVTLGPFEWVPNENVYGHDCVLMIASTAGDPSNVENFTGAETVAEWRLVPNDNNIGQRNVTIEPGGGGVKALISALDGAVFVAGNSSNRPARMELVVDMPRVLGRKGWGIDLGDNAKPFRLKPGEKRHVELKLVPGDDFTPKDLRKPGDRSIRVELLTNGMPVGGMTYQLDPDLKERGRRRRKKGDVLRRPSRDLLDRLNISAGDEVRAVQVKRVTLEIDFDTEPDSD